MKIQQVAGFEFEIDVMASIANFKCKKFIARKDIGIPHEGIIGYDFLNFDFSKIDKNNLFVFPPKVQLEQVTAILAKYFRNTNFALVFHQWYELPLGIGNLLGIPSTRLITLTDQEAITFIPSEEMREIKLSSGESFKFNGSPNIKERCFKSVVKLTSTFII